MTAVLSPTAAVSVQIPQSGKATYVESLKKSIKELNEKIDVMRDQYKMHETMFTGEVLRIVYDAHQQESWPLHAQLIATMEKLQEARASLGASK